MRIRLWNAFASNNSGSYTIVGTFRDPATARAVAAEFAELCRAETIWRHEERDASRATSPLAEFAAQQRLPENDHDLADWPEYGPPPTVAAAHHQIVVHVPYTVTMPRLFGMHIYARGGRVDTEINHAHHPVVADCTLYAPWSAQDRDRRAAALRTELFEENGWLRRRAEKSVEPVVKAAEWGSHAFRVIAVFTDLADAVAELAEIAARHGCEVQLRVLESESGDPLKAWR